MGGARIAAFAQQQPRARAARRSVRSDTALALPVSVGGDFEKKIPWWGFPRKPTTLQQAEASRSEQAARRRGFSFSAAIEHCVIL